MMQCSPDRHRNTKLPALSPRTHSLYHPYSAHGIVVFLIRTPSPLQPPLDVGVQTEPSHHSHVGARACIYSSLGVHTSYAYVRRNLLPLAHESLHPESTKCNFNINTRIQSRVTLSTELRVLQCLFFFSSPAPRDEERLTRSLTHIPVLSSVNSATICYVNIHRVLKRENEI